MNSSWIQSFKSIYRREPVLSFIATAGAVNAAIGGASAQWVLMSLGLGTVGMAISNAVTRRSIGTLLYRPVGFNSPLMGI